MREYEKLQLELIAHEYRSNGYSVQVETVLPGSGLRFDAIAQNDNGAMVLLELLNPNLSEDEIAARRHAISEAAKRHPNAMVDFRYIDLKQSAFRRFNHADGERIEDPLKKLLSTRVPALNHDPRSASKQMIALWVAYALLLRAYARHWPKLPSETVSILGLYNEFLHAQILKPAEVGDDQVSDDLFQMHEVVIAATEGASVDLAYVKQLRRHYLWLRKQVQTRNKILIPNEGLWG
jgi:hypothetical protein